MHYICTDSTFFHKTYIIKISIYTRSMYVYEQKEKNKWWWLIFYALDTNVIMQSYSHYPALNKYSCQKHYSNKSYRFQWDLYFMLHANFYCSWGNK